MQRKGASCPAGEVAPWRSYDGKQDGGSSKHQDEGSRPPQPSLFWVLDPPKWKTLIDKHMCTPAVLFAAALVTVAKTGKQPKCPSTDGRIQKWHMYTLEYYSAVPVVEYCHFRQHWMNLESIMPSEVSRVKKDKNHMISLTHEK